MFDELFSTLVRMIHCLGFTMSRPVVGAYRSTACDMDFIKQVERFLELRTNPMFEITRPQNSSRAAAMSSIIFFSAVRVPFDTK